MSSSFQKLYTHHKKQIMDFVDERTKEMHEELKQLLKIKRVEEIKKIKELIQNRTKEIKKRLGEIGFDSKTYQTRLTYFTGEEKEQLDQDIRWLQNKLADLEKSQSKEEERIEQRYSLSSFMAFPIGVLYLIPESEVKGGA